MRGFRPKPFTDEERRAIERLSKEGKTIKAIAVALGRSFYSVLGECGRGGGIKNYNAEKQIAYSKLKKTTFPISEESKNKIRDLCELGHTYEYISHELKISHNTVQRWAPKSVRTNVEKKIEELESQIEVLTQHVEILSDSIDKYLKEIKKI